jgi:hypothetical protein
MSNTTCGTATSSVRLKDDQNFWNFVFSVIFAVLLALSVGSFYAAYGGTPAFISVFDMILVSLAIFRITRLFVYDKILQFLRDTFMQAREFTGDDGRVYVERRPYSRGPLRTISDLLACPWCTAMWASLVVVYGYYMLPYAWYIILMLAIAGVASLVQLFANMLGWRAENLKLDAHAKEK